MEDVKQRERLSQAEEDVVVRELIAQRAQITALARAVALKALSIGVTADDVERIAAIVAEKRKLIQRAKEQLVESNLRLVVYLARRSSWLGAEVADLVQEGNLALMRAVDSYDPDRGVTFGRFACTSIRHAMERCGAMAKELVRIPEQVRLRRRRVLKATEHLSDKEGRAPAPDAVADYLEVSAGQVADALEGEASTCSLDACAEGTVAGGGLAAYSSEVDVADTIAAKEDERLVGERVAELDERSRRVIEARFGVERREPATLAQIGRDLGITRERARQLEARALQELRTRGSAPQRPRPRKPQAARGRPAF
jgi:RNA polymerase primary sigma factor